MQRSGELTRELREEAEDDDGDVAGGGYIARGGAVHGDRD